MNLYDFVRPLALVYAAFVVHEAGHVAAARMAGLRIWAFQVGPLCVYRDESGVRLVASRFNYGWFGIAGACQPGLAGAPLVRAVRVATAGGPAASLVMGALSLQGHGFIHWFGIFSLAIGIATLLPLRIQSDGGQLVELFRNHAEERAAFVSLGMGALCGVAWEKQANLVEILANSGKPEYRAFAARIHERMRAT